MSDSMNCRKCGARGDARCVCVPDDADLIAETLDRDRKATDGPWEAAGPYPKATVYATPQRDDEEPRHVCDVGDFEESGPALAYDQECIAAYRTAAPELARRLAALLDALDGYSANTHGGDQTFVMIGDIRAAYARNLEKSKP